MEIGIALRLRDLEITPLRADLVLQNADLVLPPVRTPSGGFASSFESMWSVGPGHRGAGMGPGERGRFLFRRISEKETTGSLFKPRQNIQNRSNRIETLLKLFLHINRALKLC